MYKEAVMKKHKSVQKERQTWLETTKTKAREELKNLALSKERKMTAALN